MGRKKQFIDKKRSATFQLLARDSSDPAYETGPSGDRVFVRVDNNPVSVATLFDERDDVDDPDSVFADAPDDGGYEDHHVGDGFSGSSSRGQLPDHVRKEILELGFPDDGYNYLTHLREIKNTGGGSAFYHNPKAKLDQLPRDVKAYDASRVLVSKVDGESNDKTIYGVASKTLGARIQKVFDPEVAALLDDSDLSRFGSDVEDLEEDFVVQANFPEGPVEVELDEKLSLVERPEVIDIGNNDPITSGLRDHMADIANVNGEKPRVLRLLDEQFDMLELKEYGRDSDEEYDNGYSDEENIHHESLPEKLSRAFKNHPLDDFGLDTKYRAPSDLLHSKKNEQDEELPESAAADVIHRCLEYAEKYENENPEEEVVLFEESSDESEIWDCETIISTYTNLDNHPGKIEAPATRRKKKLAEMVSGVQSSNSHVISLKGKEKLPVEFLPRNRAHAIDNLKDATSLKVGRHKIEQNGDDLKEEKKDWKTEQQKRKLRVQESKDEKKERKAAVKEERREARQVKKEMKGLYKGEAQRAQKVAAYTGPSSIHLM